MRKLLDLTLLLVLALSLAGCGGGGSGTGTESTPPAKPDYAVGVSVEPAAVEVDASEAENTKIVYTVTNEGAKPDTYALGFTVFGGTEWRPQGVPTSVELQPGESKDVPIPLTFDLEGSIPGFDVTLTAVSSGDPAVKGDASCQLTFTK